MSRRRFGLVRYDKTCSAYGVFQNKVLWTAGFSITVSVVQHHPREFAK